MTETAYPQFARIHVSPSAGTHEWPVVERVNGGWQSGGHHYPDSTVLEVRPLYLAPDPLDAAPVRDGVPDVFELLTAARVLQIPVDAEGMGLELMTSERQITCVLGLITAYLTMYQVVHEAEYDRLSAPELQMVISSAITEATGGEGTSGMTMAAWYAQTAGFIVAEIGRAALDNPSCPARPLMHLVRAVLHLLTTWREVQTGGNGIVVDGFRYSMGEAGEHLVAALTEAQAGLEAVADLLPADRR